MLNIKVIASGSKGNCYVIDNGESRLMLECGIPFSKILEALEYSTSGIDGVLLTHEHKDHSHCAKQMVGLGFDIYTSQGTATAVGLCGHRLNVLKSMKPLWISDWFVLPFETVHDAAEPLGFLIVSGAYKILFLTDSAYCNYRFKGVTHLMLECNFSDEILERNIENGVISGSRKTRLLESHFSLERVKDFININGSSSLQGVWLMHLSDHNSDEEMFKDEIQRLTGVPVVVC